MDKYVWQFPVNLPGGNFAVVIAEVRFGSTDIYDKLGHPKRKYWTSYRLFKRKVNADKFQMKVSAEQRNDNLNLVLIKRGLFTLN